VTVDELPAYLKQHELTGGTHCLAARRQPFRGGTSRMNREIPVRLCERLGAKFPGPTRRRWATRPPMPIAAAVNELAVR
jgi:hypothetical protein